MPNQHLYTPGSWYWVADDGRVYASQRQAIVDTTDADYLAWADTRSPSPWPRDDDGNQTNASMQAVVEQYGQFVDLTYYTINKRWLTEQGGITLSSGMPIATDDRAQAKINGTMLTTMVGATVVGQATPPPGGKPSFTTQWHAADGSFWHLDVPAITAMSNEMQDHISQCFIASSQIMDGIEAGTVTTREQIDDTFAGIVAASKQAKHNGDRQHHRSK